MGPLDQARALFSLVFNRPQPMPNLLPREGMKFAPSMGKNYQVQRPPVKPNPMKKTGAGFDQPMLQPKGPIPQKQFVQQAPAASVTSKDLAEVERKMRKGLQEYAKKQGRKDVPIEKYVPTFLQAAEKYPIFKQHPYLLPQISILESSGGVNITRENNPLNWGARIQKQGLYNPISWDESIMDAITAIAGDEEARPRGSYRHAATQYYKPFRDSNDLSTFANIYEPANKSYYDNLIKGIQFFENQ